MNCDEDKIWPLSSISHFCSPLLFPIQWVGKKRWALLTTTLQQFHLASLALASAQCTPFSRSACENQFPYQLPLNGGSSGNTEKINLQTYFPYYIFSVTSPTQFSHHISTPRAPSLCLQTNIRQIEHPSDAQQRVEETAAGQSGGIETNGPR